ncbi:hypothetical protein AXG55_09760 [Silvanigrella aquatica]|uniref:Uncharacterized protein n=1 Tax=Silvanigrella aquatica TaxID=1915309 RepID=A0A1L4D1U1_9BACT|nr:hypothetical protein AXG55_09760 [Silvanigrella aquatica]
MARLLALATIFIQLQKIKKHLQRSLSSENTANFATSTLFTEKANNSVFARYLKTPLCLKNARRRFYFLKKAMLKKY